METTITGSARGVGTIAAEIANPTNSPRTNLPRPAPSGTRRTRLELHPPDERICPKCKGMRFLTLDIPAGHPNFSQIVRCDVCGHAQQQAYLLKLSGLAGEMLGWTLDKTTRNAGNAAAFDDVAAAASNPQWFLTLHGKNGVGKSHLLAVLVNAGRANGWTSIYLTTAGLMDHLRSAYAPGQTAVTFDGLWDKIVNAKILVLDELDRWNPTPWSQEKFFELIDHRYRNGMTMLTAFATNSDLDNLPPYLSSRNYDRRCQVHEITGSDLRSIRE